MKRFITVLSSLLVLPAFAEVAPVYYDEIVEYTDEMIDDIDAAAEEAQPVVQKKNITQRNTINRSTSATRAVASATSGGQRTSVSSRAIAASPRTATTSRAAASRTARTSSVVNRTPTTATRASVTARGTQGAKPVTARVGTLNNSVMPGTRTVSGTSQKTLEDSGNALYNANSARVGVGTRRGTIRAASSSLTSTTPVITEEEVSSTTSNLTAIAELTDYCKAQYAACMDNYCNVLDDNQGRCSCSKNVKNYEKTEQALAAATESFQDVVQKIKYIGLTGEQIEMLFTETEAELAMKSNSDKSQLRTSLDSIKRKIIDVSTPNASSYEASSGMSFDLSGLLDADFTGGFDLNSFLNVSNNTSTTNVTNQRGEQLYKTATNRCKTAILNSCTAQGIDANVITNSYDLEIDKQCIAYERSLNEANKEMRSNVTNASSILQQARLMLAQNRNSYDVRGCVAAIDSCMQDEYVCGSDYELCLDPTGKYIASGEIVKGGTPGVSGGMSACTEEITDQNATIWLSNGMYELYQAWNYNTSAVGVKTGALTSESCTKDTLNSTTLNTNATRNAWGAGQNETLGAYIDVALKAWEKNYNKTTSTEDMATYILQKIGYMDENDKVHGMCASVMKQCQDYTYDSKKSSRTYKPNNEVIRQYLASTLTKIKLKQDEILADYVEDCRSDVTSCLSTNGYDETATSSTASQTAINACRAEIQTCMSTGGWKPSDSTVLTLRQMTDWVGSMLANCAADQYLYDYGSGTVTCKPCQGAKVYTDTGLTCSYTATNEEQVLNVAGGMVAMTTTGLSGQWLSNGTTNYTGYYCFKGRAYKLGTNPSTVATTSAGGQATSCSCPSGYTTATYTHTTNDTSGAWSKGEVVTHCISAGS